MVFPFRDFASSELSRTDIFVFMHMSIRFLNDRNMTCVLILLEPSEFATNVTSSNLFSK